MKALKMLGTMTVAVFTMFGDASAAFASADTLAGKVSMIDQTWADFVPDQRKKILAPLVRTPVKVPARGFILSMKQ